MSDKKINKKNMDRYFNDPDYRHKRMKMKFKLKWIFLISLFLGLCGLLTWYGFYIVSGLPTLDQLENPKTDLASKLYSADGIVLDQYSYENRTYIPLEKLPDGLVKALIATEDKDFYKHWGVNLPRFVRQMIINFVAFKKAGASTITQQLAKNQYKLKNQKETLFDQITRKLREFITAVQIERNFTKKEILEMYLNVSYFGRSSYGIESASHAYFGKPAAQLNPSEYTMLIALLKGAGVYDPVKNPERAFGRRAYVISQMVEEKYITQEEAVIINSDSLNFKSLTSEFRVGIAPHFVENIRRSLAKKVEKLGYDLYRDGLKIYTTLDSRMQRYAIQSIEEHLKDFQTAFDSTWVWSEHPDILSDAIDKAIKENETLRKIRNAKMRDSLENVLRHQKSFIDSVKRATQNLEVGFVVINPHNGQIKAMVGGHNYRTFKYGLNHVTQIKRQPGSAFKPFVYTVAIDNGYPPCYEIQNNPVTIVGVDGTRWAPENYDKHIGGNYTLREALKKSLNIIAVRMILEIAPARQVAKMANNMGIESKIRPYDAIALGTEVVTPLEITSAFGVYANEGVHVSPISVSRIEDKDGNVIESMMPIKKEVLSKETAYIMTDMLKGVVNGGTGSSVRRFYNGPAAGKTGTTNDYADAWFVGFTPQLAAGVWVGFDEPRIRMGSINGQGGRAAAPIFGRFMGKVYADSLIRLSKDNFIQPEGVFIDTICVETKKKARPYCTDKITEIFNIKYPVGLCEKHTSANIGRNKDDDDVRKKSKTTW